MTLSLISIQGVDSTSTPPNLPVSVNYTGNLSPNGRFVSIVPVAPLPATPSGPVGDLVGQFGFFGTTMLQATGHNYAGVSFVGLFETPDTTS